MQDKEFDQFWMDRLSGAEIEPPLELWGKIETDLKPKKKRSSQIFWTAAAAALILMSAGLLFTKTEKVRLQGVAPLAENISAPAPVLVLPNIVDDVPVGEEYYSGTPLIIAPSIDIDYGSSDGTPVKKANKKILAPMQPLNDRTRPITTAAIKEPLKVNDGWQNETNILASTNAENTLADEVVNENDQAEKRGIRNAGDLVNFIVEKIDKREHKLIKFSTDEDDNSSLVGINIGFIKINSKKHK